MSRARWALAGLLLLLLPGCQTGPRGVGVDLTAALRLYRQQAHRKPMQADKEQLMALLPAEKLNDLGVLYEGEGRLEEAAWAYQHAIWQSPRYATAYVNLGNVRRKQGRTEEARERYRQALSADAGNVLAANNLGDLAAADGTGLAEAVAKLAPLANQPGTYRAYTLDTLGWLYHRQGEETKAREALTAALATAPEPGLAQTIREHLEAIERSITAAQ